MTSTKKLKPRKFMWLTESTIRREHFDLTAWQSADYRRKLQKGIYYRQPVTRGAVSWNMVLLEHWLTFGECPEHQRLVEEYYVTLPKVG